MRVRGLLISSALLAVLAAAVYWSQKLGQSDDGQEDPDRPHIVQLFEDQIRKIEVHRAAGETTIVQKTDAGAWEITSPKRLAADTDAVRGIASVLSPLSSDRVVEEKAEDLEAFGLSKPSVEIVIGLADGKSEKILIGDMAPTGSGYYTMKDGDPRVFVLAAWGKAGLDKTAADLRDKRLLTFDPEKVVRVELAAQGRPMEFGRNSENQWQIVRPRPMRADSIQVEELIRKLKDARDDEPAGDPESLKTAAAFARAARVAIARVTDSNGTQQIEVRKDRDLNYYARSSAVKGTFHVSLELGQGVDKSIDDFRNKKLFDFGWSDPNKIEIRQGDKQLAYHNAGGDWMSGSERLEATTVQALVDKLRNLSASKLLETGAGTPLLEVAVTSVDGKRVERVAISREGENYFARRENEPTIYALDGKVVEELQTAISGIKQAATSQTRNK